MINILDNSLYAFMPAFGYQTFYQNMTVYALKKGQS